MLLSINMLLNIATLHMLIKHVTKYRHMLLSINMLLNIGICYYLFILGASTFKIWLYWYSLMYYL